MAAAGPFDHIKPAVPFLKDASDVTTSVLHVASSVPGSILPTLHYWVEAYDLIGNAAEAFKGLGYDVVVYTPYTSRELYERNYPNDPLQAGSITCNGIPGLSPVEMSQQSTDNTQAPASVYANAFQQLD